MFLTEEERGLTYLSAVRSIQARLKLRLGIAALFVALEKAFK